MPTSPISPRHLRNPDFQPAETAVISSDVLQSLSPENRIYAVSTSGTGGEELLDIPLPTDFNPDLSEIQARGYLVTVYLHSLCVAEDSVVVTIDGEEGATLTNIGDAATFIYTDGAWHLNETDAFTISDAPEDDALYGRLNGEWAEAATAEQGATADTALQPNAISGSFTAQSGETITIVDGQITAIEAP